MLGHKSITRVAVGVMLVALAVFGKKSVAEAQNVEITANKTLTANTSMTSLTTTGGTLDLNGYTLTVTGNVVQKGGIIDLNGGKLIVKGNLTQEASYGSKLLIDEENEEVSVSGSVMIASTTSQYPKKGTLKIGKDFTLGANNEYAFCMGYYGTLQTVFTGTGSHKINIPDSAFVNCEFGKLKVESGKITSANLSVAGVLLSNLEVTLPSGCAELKLGKMSLNGNSLKINGNAAACSYTTIDLKNGKLTVTGNLTQKQGVIDLNDGKLVVNGNFTQENQYQVKLLIEAVKDEVTIGGSFISSASVAQYPKLGTVKIGKDMVLQDGAYNTFNTEFYKSVHLIFTGSGIHNISIDDEYADTCAFYGLKVESGKLCTDKLYIAGGLESDLNVTLPSGCTELKLGETALNGRKVKINGNVEYSDYGALNLEQGELTITGNLRQSNGKVYLNKGKMYVNGNYTQTAKGLLAIESLEDEITIGGSFSTAAVSSQYPKEGLMRVGGDFTVTSGAYSAFAMDYYGTLRTILTGNKNHVVTITAEDVHGFGQLTVESGMITANRLGIKGKLLSDLTVSIPGGVGALELHSVNLNGHNVKVNGNVDTKNDYSNRIDLQGGRLEVYGNLNQQSGTIIPNGGTLKVTGNYTQVKDYSSELIMSNPNDVVDVDGSFATYSIKNRNLSHQNALSEGVMYVGGDFVKGQGDSGSFCASGNHIVILDGASRQHITFDDTAYSHINILVTAKSITKDYSITPANCYQTYISQNVMDFVTRLYTTCLGRSAEKSGLIYWATQLMKKETTGAELGYSFVFSEEYISKGTSDTEFLTMLYKVFMNRDPEAGGMGFWGGLLANKTHTREMVYKGFAESVEYGEICTQYGIVRGSVDVVIVNSNGIEEFVKRCYTQALGREAEQGGLEYWTYMLTNKLVSAETVAGEGFIFSPEFVNKGLSNEEYIKVLYRTFFGREAESDGLNYWITAMTGGMTREDLLHFFVGSDEFHAIMAQYGL